MNLFGGYFKTTDDKTWCVAFRALSWDDAASIAEQCQVTLDGMILETFMAATHEKIPSNSCYAAWEFAEGKFHYVPGEES